MFITFKKVRMKLKGRWLVKALAVALSLFMVMGSLTLNEVKADSSVDADGYSIPKTIGGGNAGEVHWYCYDAPSGQRATIGVKLVIKPDSGTRMTD